MENGTQTVDVPHLGGSSIGYRFGRPYDPSLPTLVMVNSFTTSVELYRPQFGDSALNDVANVLAIEPYGHGATRATYRQFTYWASAVANLQVLDALDCGLAYDLVDAGLSALETQGSSFPNTPWRASQDTASR